MCTLRLRTFIAGAVLLFGAAMASAAPTTGLYLTMDGSGSISTANFTTQVNAYSNALTSFFASNPSAYGQVAIGGGIFGGTFSEFFPVTDISNSTVLGNLTSAILGLDPGRGGINTGSTAIGNAITASANSLQAYETGLGTDLKLIIDVTTDGANNSGSNPATVASSLTPSPINAINCLGIGASANCSFVAGAGTNYGTVSYTGLQSALTDKIRAETVPEPATLALVGAGLLGIAFSRRKRAC